MSRPDLPGRRARAPEVLEYVLVAQRVHVLPVAGMAPGAELAVVREALHRLTLPHGRIAFDIVEDAGLEHEESAVDPGVVALGLLAEASDAGHVQVQGDRPET